MCSLSDFREHPDAGPGFAIGDDRTEGGQEPRRLITEGFLAGRGCPTKGGAKKLLFERFSWNLPASQRSPGIRCPFSDVIADPQPAPSATP
jgi:hypothetical protein